MITLIVCPVACDALLISCLYQEVVKCGEKGDNNAHINLSKVL